MIDEIEDAPTEIIELKITDLPDLDLPWDQISPGWMPASEWEIPHDLAHTIAFDNVM